MVDDVDPANPEEVRAVKSLDRVRYEWLASVPASEAVIETVAGVTNREPTSLPPLYTAVDPEALDALLSPSHTVPDRCVQVSFKYTGVIVVVEASGHIEIRPTDDSTRS